VRRAIEIVGVHVEHPRDRPSRVELVVGLRYLKGEPVEVVELAPRLALRLIEELVSAYRIVYGPKI